jgi:hypothetical protein
MKHSKDKLMDWTIHFLEALLILSFILGAISLLALTGIGHVSAQVIGDGIPEIDRKATPSVINVTYTGENGQIISEPFHVPVTIPDFGDVSYVAGSTQDPNRDFFKIPNFGLAKFHWWLFGFDVLPRVQRQYADCIGEIKGYQKLLGMTPLIDDPSHPLYDIVTSVREYTVPFEPIQFESEEYNKDYKLPARLIEAQVDAHAAVASVNVTVYHKGLCRQTAELLQREVKARMK